jgi:hypothetical protein
VPSWRREPEALEGVWTCFRQVDPQDPALFHSAGEPVPSQVSGRWHRQGQGYAQYLSPAPAGAWAELARYYSIRSAKRARAQRRDLWVVRVEETRIADLATFDAWEACGLDPRIAVAEHGPAQDLADELRDAGYRGVMAPSAALTGIANLTIFGERYEKVLTTTFGCWANPDRDAWLACTLAAPSSQMPTALTTDTVFRTGKHEGYRAWLVRRGRALPADPP